MRRPRIRCAGSAIPTPSPPARDVTASAETAPLRQFQFQFQFIISNTVQYYTETRSSRPTQHPLRTMTQTPRECAGGGVARAVGARRLVTPPTWVFPQPQHRARGRAHVRNKSRLHYHQHEQHQAGAAQRVRGAPEGTAMGRHGRGGAPVKRGLGYGGQ